MHLSSQYASTRFQFYLNDNNNNSDPHDSILILTYQLGVIYKNVVLINMYLFNIQR